VLADPDGLQLAAPLHRDAQLGQLLGLEAAAGLVRVGGNAINWDGPGLAQGARAGVEIAARGGRCLGLGRRRRPDPQACPHGPAELVGHLGHQATSRSRAAPSRARNSSHRAWITLDALLLGLNSVMGWPTVTAIFRSRDTGTVVSRTSPG